MPKVISKKGRKFDCFPAAVLIIMINENKEILFFSQGQNKWEVIAGGLEEGETILEGAQRELHEEAGADIVARPIGVVNTQTFKYDEAIQNMISIYYVMRYEKGQIVPSDDMQGAVFEWWSIEKIRRLIGNIIIPKEQLWVFERALNLFSDCIEGGIQV